MLRRQLERYGRWLVVIGILVVLSLATATYILSQQHLITPLLDHYTVRATFDASPGLEPGLQQPVNVAGVRVGTITDVKLENGRAVVSVVMEREKLPRVYRDATASLVPRTPLKDMQIEVFPGHRSAGPLPSKTAIPVAATTTNAETDEFTNALDADTRDFFRLLVAGADQGTRGRGQDLRSLLKALGPTAEQVRPLGEALAARRRELRHLVHSLAVLGRATQGKDRELSRVVVAGNRTLKALSSQERALTASVAKLPGTLSQTRKTLESATPLARELPPALDALLPAVKRLPETLDAVRPLVNEAEPILRRRLRPLVRDLQPLARDLGPTTRDLSAVTPDLISAAKVLTYTVNELAYNPPGGNEGFLFWLAWFVHNSNSWLSTEDAHGAVARGLVIADCGTATRAQTLAPLLELFAGPLSAC